MISYRTASIAAILLFPACITLSTQDTDQSSGIATGTSNGGNGGAGTPKFLLGVNLNGPALSIGGNDWMSYQDAVLAGMTTNSAEVWSGTYNFKLVPQADAQTKQMLESLFWRKAPPVGEGFTIGMPVPAGTYHVELYCIENFGDGSRDIDIRIEGTAVATALLGNAKRGEWVVSGPHTIEVTDGKINLSILRHSKGDPTLSGFAIYH